MTKEEATWRCSHGWLRGEQCETCKETMTKDKALKLALEALEKSVATCFDRYAHEQVMSRPEHFINQAIITIKEALAQPAQGPDRQTLQANGTHPAPCARHCEAQAFKVEIRNLKAQLAQPAQEPVAEFKKSHRVNYPLLTWNDGYVAKVGAKLYTTPQQRPWVGLTDEERKEIMRYEKDFWGVSGWEWKCMEALEAKLKEKNT